jgi:hypothetical protein
MDVSGSPREGWMTFVPLMVLLFIIVYVLGGPTQFMNLIAQWLTDVVSVVMSWLKHL